MDEKIVSSLCSYVVTICLSGRILEGALEAIQGSGLDGDALKDVETKMWRFVIRAQEKRTPEWWTAFADLVNTLNKHLPNACGQLNSYTSEILDMHGAFIPQETEDNKNA